MESKKYFVLSICGEKAVEIAEKFQNGYCYRGIYNHGKKIAQCEAVLHDLVDVTVFYKKDIETVLNQLVKIGFSGCPCWICEAIETGCYCSEKEICGLYI